MKFCKSIYKIRNSDSQRNVLGRFSSFKMAALYPLPTEFDEILQKDLQN